MSRVARVLGFFSIGIGISLIIGYWLKQEETRSRERLLARFASPASHPPETHVVLSNKTLAAAESVDDLTTIHGIGIKTAEALHAVGITTYAALANSSASDLQRRLQNVRGLSKEKIVRCIQEAKELEM